MTNTIACFHMDLGSKEHNEVVDYWQEVWRANGWKTRVLTLSNAQMHPSFNGIWEKANSLPTVNNRDFERACFIRWCAFALFRGAIADSDVFPRVNYPPRDYEIPYTADPCGGPGFMVGSTFSYDHILHAIFDYEPKPTDTVFGKPHVSDLTVLQNDNHFARNNDIACYGVDGWRDKPLIHFGNAYLKRLTGTKLERITKILKDEGACYV